MLFCDPQAVLVGVSVQKLNKDTQTKVTMADAREIKKLAQQPRVLDQLAASLAPSIYGHAVIKKGKLCSTGFCFTTTSYINHLAHCCDSILSVDY